MKPHGAPATGGEALAVRGLTLPAANPHDWTLKQIDLTVRKGEILGIAGIAGNGQSELFAAISGERLAPAAASVAIAGRACGRDRHRRAPAPRRRLRARGAARPCGGADAPPERERDPLPSRDRRGRPRRHRRSRAGAAPGGERSSRASTCAGRRAIRRRASSRAATCRNSSSAARSSAARPSSSSISRPGASTPARRGSSGRR